VLHGECERLVRRVREITPNQHSLIVVRDGQPPGLSRRATRTSSSYTLGEAVSAGHPSRDSGRCPLELAT
jgi:hypothetical protein